ncbi:MAG TPA: ATP-binding protein, partial [Blastocatellia bacterium]|nr:ATP-binding protein [Blastocatellia bacterium]
EQLLAREQAARSQAEEASRLKDDFLATVSHELRTPLNSILGWARMLRGGKLDAEAAARAMETIERNARSQAEIIEDILDVSRIITGRLRLDFQTVDLQPVIEAAIDSLRPAAEARGVRLQPVLDPQAGLVSGDPNRLQQVVWNLLSNAIKFTPRGGRVHVALERISSHIDVTVSDTGVGIRPEFLPYVFDRFRQADSSSTRTHGGLGLGLAIVRHLVELHGGAVTAESGGEGQGATFHVRLPLMTVRSETIGFTGRHLEASGKESPLLSDSLKGVRVLVVDDEADARDLLTAALGQYGVEVMIAASAAEALSAVEVWRPDVLVSDIGMPVEDGYALIRRLRALTPECGGLIPAVALTAYARSEDRLRALSAGYQMHVAKPVDPAELAAVIASLAGRMKAGKQ